MASKKNKDDSTTTSQPPSGAPLTFDDVTSPGAAPPEVVAEAAPEPPAWTPSKEVVPSWVIAAQRLAWKVKDGAGAWKSAFGTALPGTEMRAQWTGGDVEYSYFKGGQVLARFRPDSQHGEVFGVLQTDPIAEFDKDPEPPAEQEIPTA